MAVYLGHSRADGQLMVVCHWVYQVGSRSIFIELSVYLFILSVNSEHPPPLREDSEARVLVNEEKKILP